MEQANQSAGYTTHLDAAGIVRVTLGRPGEKVNLISGALLESLDRSLDDWKARDEVRGVLFRSDKPGMFVAGMNVDEIAGVVDAFRAADGARFGQRVLEKIASLGKPSACAINGICVGGGTELALACTHRLAADDPAVRIGLPEVKLGIIPGFGGTQRLPRLVGLLPSLDLILTGRQLDARRARRLGLVDAVVPPAYLEREAVRALLSGRRPPRKGRSLMARAMELPPLRRLALNKASRKTAEKVSRASYPAPFRALDAIDAAFRLPLREGLDLEARIIGELVPTRTSKNLIWIFKNQSALKDELGGVQAAPRRVRRVGVLGAGVMGGGISQLAADRRLPVRLRDIDYGAILSALQTASAVWERRVKRRRMTRGEAAQRMAFIAPTLELTGFRNVDLVIEAVVERLEVKQQVLAELEQRLGERAVFASNTSSLPISDIAAKAMHPERVVGLHFFNPVHRMPLVEVIAGNRSSPEAIATVHRLAVKLGKTPVVVRDSPGFLVNRILMLYLNEALQLLSEGVAIDAIDRAMDAFGMPMGPCKLLDQIGLDTANHVAGVLEGAFGRRIGASSGALGALVADGRLGAKNGKGFYRYSGGRPTEPDPAVPGLVGATGGRDLPPETLQERMVLAMVNEGAVSLEDGVVREPREVDIAMVMGTGFPPFRGGLLRHADAVGVAVVVDRLSRLADAHGERFRPASLLREMVREQHRFYGGA